MPTTLRSFSKINLGLAIGPVRGDGFHSLTTLYQTLAAHDLVTVTARPADATRIAITSNDERVPTDKNNTAESNTAFKAVRMALDALGITAAVSIHIEKRLPVQGGMGAGSANAAAALIALERELRAHGLVPAGIRWRSWGCRRSCELPPKSAPMFRFFLMGSGTGWWGAAEEFYPMPDLPATQCVIALPEIGTSTPLAFRDWDALHSAGSLERNVERGNARSVCLVERRSQA